MHCVQAPIINPAFAPERKQKFPALMPESGSPRLLLKERLQAFFFRNGYFDIYDSALGLPGLKARYPTTVSTPEDLSCIGRKKVVAALQQMVEQGEATLRELIGGKFIKPEAPIGYWDDRENARFWLGQLLHWKMESAGLAEEEKTAAALAKEGIGLDYRQTLHFREAQRKAFCSINTHDFIDCGLDGLLQKPYQGKIHFLAFELYPELGIRPWQLSSTPKNYFEKKENRVAAIRWVASMLRKKPEEYNPEEKMVAQLRKADMEMMTLGDWRAWNRLTEKDPLALTSCDLKKFGIEKILDHAKGEHRLAQLVCEAYPERKYRAWQMKYGIKGYFSHPAFGRERRVEAIRYTAELLKKPVCMLTGDDLNAQSCEILCSYPVNAVLFAAWEADHSITPESLKHSPSMRTIGIFNEWKLKQAA